MRPPFRIHAPRAWLWLHTDIVAAKRLRESAARFEEAIVQHGSHHGGNIVQALGGAVVMLCVVPLTAAIWAVALGAI